MGIVHLPALRVAIKLAQAFELVVVDHRAISPAGIMRSA
jgi:hypothetical protein